MRRESSTSPPPDYKRIRIALPVKLKNMPGYSVTSLKNPKDQRRKMLPGKRRRAIWKCLKRN